MQNRSRRSSTFGTTLTVLVLLAAACTSTASTGTEDPVNDVETPVEADGTDDNKDEPEEAPDLDAIEDTALFDAPDPDLTSIEISDDIRMGVLDNGLTYFVQSNDSPGGSVALRLAIKAGGLHEDPIGTGAAHFLEHMMFNGTERFPGGSLDATLRSIGAEIGPDFNAYTADAETVYQLQVADQGENVSIAFDVLAEWASAALIESDAVIAEAPVVREELRVRDETGDGIIGVTFEKAYYAETPFEGVNVSGTAETVNAISASDLRAYYDTWYRPDNMAVIAVGDRSLDDLERQIIDRFEPMTARGAIVEQPNVGAFDLRSEPLVDVAIVPSYGDSFVSVDIPVRTWDQSTLGGNELLLTEVVLGTAINNRLSEGVANGRLDLRRAGGGWFPYNRDLAYLGFNVDADDLVSGTEALMTELEGSLQNPFTQGELDRAAEVYKSIEQQRRAEAATTQDSDYADELVSYFLDGADVAAVDESVARNIEILDSISVDQANNHWGWMLSSAAPIVLVVGPDAERVGDPDDHLAAVQAGAEAIVDAVEDDVAEIDELIKPPRPVDEVESNDLASGDVELVFENGHRVLFAESTISEGQVLLVSESPGGRSVLSDDDGALASAALSTVSASGLGEWSPTQMRRYLANIDVNLSPVVSDFSEGFSGSASTEDLETMFQLLHLMVTAPRVDDVPFAQRVEANRDFVEQVGLDSSTATSVAATNARTGGGKFAGAPTSDQLESLTADDAQRIYEDRFSALDEHTIVIVGDADEDDIVDFARTWIGSLPAASGVDSPDQFPATGELTEVLAVGSGTAGGSFLLIATGTADETVENQVLADLASRIVDDRIFTVVREELGASYGGSSFTRFAEPGDDVDLVISIDGNPGRIDEIADTVNTELASIAAGETTDADFAEAVAVLNAELGFINNGFLIESLFDEANSQGGDLLSRQTQIAALSSIKPPDVARFMDDIITSGQSVDVRNIPG